MLKDAGKPVWIRLVEAFARGSAAVGLFLAASLGIFGVIAFQGGDYLSLVLGPGDLTAWLVAGVIGAIVSCVLAVLILRADSGPGEATPRDPQS